MENTLRAKTTHQKCETAIPGGYPPRLAYPYNEDQKIQEAPQYLAPSQTRMDITSKFCKIHSTAGKIKNSLKTHHKTADFVCYVHEYLHFGHLTPGYEHIVHIRA